MKTYEMKMPMAFTEVSREEMMTEDGSGILLGPLYRAAAETLGRIGASGIGVLSKGLNTDKKVDRFLNGTDPFAVPTYWA